MSDTLISGTRPAMARVRSRPIRAPIRYRTNAPTTDPAVVQAIAATRLMSPWLAVNPARGRITSLGIGGNRFSSATASPAPGAPSVSMIRIAHPGDPTRLGLGRQRQQCQQRTHAPTLPEPAPRASGPHPVA